MIIQGNANNLVTTSHNRTLYQPQFSAAAQPLASQNQSQAQVQKESFARRFDSVTISGERGSPASQLQELKSRLVQEVRASRPAESVEAVRDDLRNGVYNIDARAIARKMLLLGDEL